jgi:hypothetical protein
MSAFVPVTAGASIWSAAIKKIDSVAMHNPPIIAKSFDFFIFFVGFN